MLPARVLVSGGRAGSQRVIGAVFGSVIESLTPLVYSIFPAKIRRGFFVQNVCGGAEYIRLDHDDARGS